MKFNINISLCNKYYSVVLFCLFSLAGQAQSVKLDWAKSVGGAFTDSSNSITIGASGNLYITGHFQDTVDFDPDTSSTFELISRGNDDVFILKLNPNGNFIWAKSMGGLLEDRGYSITTDASENVYVTGYFHDTVDFDPGTAIFDLISHGSFDVFIQKLDVNGDFIWAKSMGGKLDDLAFSISMDVFGNVYTTGYFLDTADFDPGTATFNLISQGSIDIFIQKLDSNGIFKWAKSMGGSSHDVGRSITTDAFGNAYVTGFFKDTVDFDPDTSSFKLVSNGYSDAFIQKLDANGKFKWAVSSGAGATYAHGTSITTDAQRSLYATVSSYQNNFEDIIVHKLDTNGNFIWTKSMVGVNTEVGTSITTDASKSVYVTGFFRDSVDFDPGASIYRLTAKGIYDIFVVKLDSNGGFMWAKSMGGNYKAQGSSIISNNSGDVYLTGPFGDIVDFDPGPDTFNLVSDGYYYDAYILKLSPCAVDSVSDVIVACDSLTWIDGITYTESNDSTTFILSNSVKCDSVVTLNLTINKSNTGIDVITACDSYTWIDGITYTASNNSATFNLTNATGCDSIVTLNLTLPTVKVGVTATNSSITADATGALYQWLDCNNNYAVINGESARTFTVTVNGKYAVEVIQSGCTDTSECVNISTIGIPESILFNSVSIFPNPNDGIINIDLGKLKGVSLNVFSAYGELIYYKENISVDSYQLELNAGAGVYIIELNSQGEKRQYKLMKK